MKNLVVTTLGLVLAVSAASPTCWAQIKFDNGGANLDFLTANNWDPDGVPDNSLGNQYAINDGFVVTYNSPLTTSVPSLLVGADAPQTPGDFGTPGTLNIADGKLNVTGAGDAFHIGRACCSGDGAVVMTGDAVLEINGSDPIVGTRDNGLLDVGGDATVLSIRSGSDTTVYWRLGNYGPSFDTGTIPGGLQGNGTLHVHGTGGTFNAHVIFIGDNDSSGTLRVSESGSVLLTGNLVPRPSGFQANGSATVEMSGSNATLNAYNLESASELGEIATKYVFEKTDAVGLSAIKLIDAVNITNNDLVVDLNGYDLAPGGTHLLFDAAPNRIFGAFTNVTVNGGNPAYTYGLVYRNFHHGDILLRRVPEPSSLALLGLGMLLAFGAKRREAR